MNLGLRQLILNICALSLTCSFLYSDSLNSDLLNKLPQVGKWVLTDQKKPLEWLGVKFEGKTLYGPINLLLIDGLSKTEGGSVAFLEQQCAASGFRKRLGHSTGYVNEIDGQYLKQIPKEWGTAFSDNDFWNENSHGAFFGPLKTSIGFVYTGAFSREKFVLFGLIHHNYVSYEQARVTLVSALESTGCYIQIGRVFLGNAESADSTISTGDHDGYIVVLKRIR